MQEWIYFPLIGVIAGWLAGRIMKGRGFGLVGNLIVGVLGALIGGAVFKLVGLGAYGVAGSLVMAVAGAMILLVLVGFVKRA